MSTANKDGDQGVGGLLAASELRAQLHKVCKRKRAFGGQAVDVRAVRRVIEQKGQEKGGR
jgi:hypothetical protein